MRFPIQRYENRPQHCLKCCGLPLLCAILSPNRCGGDSMAEKKEQKRVPGYKSENQKYKSLLVMQFILKSLSQRIQ